jgi:hypothetical protein
MSMRLFLTAAALCSLAAPALPQGPIGTDAPVTGSRTKVMTLGTFHLSERQGFNPQWLAPTLDKLAAYRPDIITIEAISGEQCAMMKANPDRYSDAVNSYCWNTADIEKATGLSVAAANAEIRKALDAWPTEPSAAQRRRLALLFLAAGDPTSAEVQWLRLPKAERREGDGVTAAMLPILDRTNGKLNENYEIAAALAARLGLERVYQVDDHSADAVTAHAPKAFEDALNSHFGAVRQSPLLAEYLNDMAGLLDAPSTLAYYRKINAPHAQDAQVRADFGGAMAQQGHGLWGRHYVGWWDVRNLRMAANIRETFAAHPGVRVLNIVGSSHKPWYDAYMGMMADVEVVDAETVLR